MSVYEITLVKHAESARIFVETEHKVNRFLLKPEMSIIIPCAVIGSVKACRRQIRAVSD
jgi:hypothetical protein